MSCVKDFYISQSFIGFSANQLWSGLYLFCLFTQLLCTLSHIPYHFDVKLKDEWVEFSITFVRTVPAEGTGKLPVTPSLVCEYKILLLFDDLWNLLKLPCDHPSKLYKESASPLLPHIHALSNLTQRRWGIHVVLDCSVIKLGIWF